MPDDALAEPDWAVASLHYNLRRSRTETTRRLIKLVKHPHVHAIGHPSGRLLGRRKPVAVDLGEVLHVAHEEGCAMEVNSQPDRLDLTDTACMAAKRGEPERLISSDSHSVREFDLSQYRINQARRGWLEPADVLNSRPLKSLHLS